MKSIKYDRSMLKMFWYWINERHHIYLRRRSNQPWPWTEDTVLQNHFFTNVYRQLDRTTQEWLKRRYHLHKPTPGDLLFHCIAFRMFNLPETYDTLYYNLNVWDLEKAIALLRHRKEVDHEQLYTGAYMITTGGKSLPKYEATLQALDILSPIRESLAKEILKSESLAFTTDLLATRIPLIGTFVGYEVACDLRFTPMLTRAKDTLSWANPGNGAMRGIHLLLTGNEKWPTGTPRPNYLAIMRDLWLMREKHLGKHVLEYTEWPFELREIEHSLCEFYKYTRASAGLPTKRRYRHREEQLELDL